MRESAGQVESLGAAWQWLIGTTQVQAACLELLLLLPLLPLVVVLLRAASPARSVMPGMQ